MVMNLRKTLANFFTKLNACIASQIFSWNVLDAIRDATESQKSDNDVAKDTFRYKGGDYVVFWCTFHRGATVEVLNKIHQKPLNRERLTWQVHHYWHAADLLH